MSFCISHASLAQFWIWASRIQAQSRSSLSSENLLARPREANPSPLTCTKQEAATFCKAHDIAAPLDLLVPNRGQRRKTAGYRYHLQSRLPEDNPQLIGLPDGNLIGTPALCLLQLSTQLDPLDLLKLAFEFCGDYVLDQESSRGFLDRPRLTTPEELLQLATAMKGSHGVSALRDCCGSLLGGARSPKEAGLCAALGPIGYDLPAPKLNYAIPLGRKAREAYGAKRCVCDLYWPGLDVEYDSDANHSGSEGGARDSLRAAALALEGIEVVHLYSKNLTSLSKLDAVAMMIGQKIGTKPAIALGEERVGAARVLSELLGHHSHPF